MKSFMLFLCLAAAEKLDRTYLPPPGSKFSGGIDGDIQAPFEIPKETYSTTLRPDIYKNGALSPDDTKIEIGINRGPPRPGSPGNIITSGGHRPSDYYQNTYKVPTTTTSYAFTTTTTHPPNEAYETTTGHINPVTGLPTAFDFPTTAPSFINPEGNYQGNQQVPFQQTQQPGRRPVYGPSQYPATSTLAPTSQFVEQSRPDFVQGQGQVQSQRPEIAQGLIQRPDTSSSQDLSQPNLPHGNNFNKIENQRPGFQPGSTRRPGFSQTEDLSKYQGSRYPANVPGIGQQNFLVPSTSPPGTTPSAVQYGGDLDQGILNNQNNVPLKPISNIPVPNYPGQNQFENNIAPGQQLQQVLQQGPYRQPGQAQYGQNQGTSAPSQYSVSQTDEIGRPINQSNNIYKPISTVPPTSYIPDSNQYFSTTPGSQPSTTVYPTGSYPTTPISPNTRNQVNPSGFVPRPERPQAESDRNAIILNYENVITPEGFAYTFDTSNGIHADESGTAVDGVKAKGSYSYIGDDGKLYSIVYTADENGFVPHGDHLPTSPPIPEAIKKVIEQAKKDQEDGISDDGTYDEDKYGHMKYQGKKPQRPNQINIDGEVPERYNNQYTQNNRQKQRPQSGQRVPVFSNKNDYNEDIEKEKNQDRESPINNDNRQKFTSDKPLFKRPGEVPEGNNEEYNTHFNDETGVKIGSNRPIDRLSDDRRQFGSKISVQRPDQYFENDKNNLKPGQGNTSIENYPVFIKTKEKYYVDANRNKPIDNKSIQRVGGKLDNSQDYKDLGDYDISNPTDIPSDFGNNEQREYNNKAYIGEESTQKPGQYSSTPGSFQNRYGNKIHPINTTNRPFDQTNIYNYQESSRPGSIDKYLPGKVYSDQPASSATTNAPISSQYTGFPIIVMQQAFENQPGPSYRPASNGPSSNIPIAHYDLTKKNKFDSSGPQIPVSGEVNVSNDKYSSSRRKPQPSTIDALQQDNEYNVNRITEPGATKYQNLNRPIPGRRPIGDNRYTTVAQTKEEEGYQYLPPQRKFEPQQPQNFVSTSNRPSNDRTYFNKGEVAKPFTTPDASRDEDAPEDDLEYTQGNNQYKAPQDNLIQTGLRPTTPSPQNYEKYNKENGPVNYDGVNQQRPILNQGGKYEGEKDKFTTISSTRRPTYQQTQTTSRPQQQFGPTVSVYETTKGIPDRTVRPHVGDRVYDRDGNKITYVSSSPTPAQSTHFKVTQPTTLEPERQNLDGYVGVNDQTPAVQRFFPTTTQAPAQRPGSFNGILSQNVNEQTPPQSPYQTTYRPMVSGIDLGEALGTTVRPDKVPFRRPGYSQTQIPSTTYRPALVPSNTVTEKQITVDNFGRPVSPSELENQQVVPSTTYRPAFFPSNTVTEKQITVDNFGRPVPPSELGNQQVVTSTTYRPAFYPSKTVTEKQTFVDNFGQPVPNSDLNQQEYRPGVSGTFENIGPSSQDSRRPQSEFKPIFDMYGRPLRPSGGSTMEKVFGEDFSGPKQEQKFDPERGYYY